MNYANEPSQNVSSSRLYNRGCTVYTHFTLFAQQFKMQMQCVQYASYSSLGGCRKARSALNSQWRSQDLEMGAQGVWGTEAPQRGPGAEPLVGGSGGA